MAYKKEQQAKFAPKAMKVRAELEKAEAVAVAAAVRAKVELNGLAVDAARTNGVPVAKRAAAGGGVKRVSSAPRPSAAAATAKGGARGSARAAAADAQLEIPEMSSASRGPRVGHEESVGSTPVRILETSRGSIGPKSSASSGREAHTPSSAAAAAAIPPRGPPQSPRGRAGASKSSAATVGGGGPMSPRADRRLAIGGGGSGLRSVVSQGQKHHPPPPKPASAAPSSAATTVASGGRRVPAAVPYVAKPSSARVGSRAASATPVRIGPKASPSPASAAAVVTASPKTGHLTAAEVAPPLREVSIEERVYSPSQDA